MKFQNRFLEFGAKSKIIPRNIWLADMEVSTISNEEIEEYIIMAKELGFEFKDDEEAWQCTYNFLLFIESLYDQAVA
jgi:hypothetical protein